ncbi:piezo type mechanosensitive ion channel component [Arctopsyche grandis]|uniref:piezo type mechanosensitive ion channel component n=1 Tax=Arctopsyche grandis TaxID=121162 RepID=UPI00406D901C
MANYFICFFLLRIVLPACIISSVIIRPIGFSLLYLLLMFYLPFVPVPTAKTFKGHAGHYLRCVLVISVITMFCQIAWQITIVSIPMKWYDDWLKYCEPIEAGLRHAGLVDLNNLDATTVLVWVSPEILMLVSSTIIYIIISKLCKGAQEDETQTNNTKRKGSFIVNFGKYLSLFMLLISGCLRPSILSGLYYLSFLGGATWWACGKELSRGFAIVCKCLMFILFSHITLLFVYQSQWIIELLPPQNQMSRYFGFTQLISMNCTDDPRDIQYLPLEWASFLSPVALLLTYYLIAFESSALLKPQLIRTASPSRKFLARRSNASSSIYYQDSAGSVTVGAEEGLTMQNSIDQDEKPSFVEQMLDTFISLFQIMIRSSYVATVIISMTWSITYHSWLSFVFLLWANVVWMIHDQRGFTLRSSPVLVIYAQILLLAQYIYGMDLTEDELPSSVQGMNMKQIGFGRPDKLPCLPIFVKSLYTTMFMITLWQFVQDKKERKQSTAIADIVAPLQVTVGAATPSIEDPNVQTSPFLKKFGAFVKGFLTKYWICVVAIMLFVIGITGQRMTVFRILYMALFLIFILTFQISRRAWRKMMYVFWVTVIVYSMCILVLIYTYQFDHFEEYWENYLRVPKTLQLDIGLEKYEIKDLFLRLVTPTFFLIMAVIQLHYFHTDFLSISHIKSRSSSVARQDSQGLQSLASSMIGGSSIPPSTPRDKQPPEAEEDVELRIARQPTMRQHSSISHTAPSTSVNFSTWIAHVQEKLASFLKMFIDFVFLFLELHLIKLVLVSIMLLCVFDVCALHFGFVLIVSISLLFKTKVQVVVIQFVSVVTCILLLAKMIYQIEYIVHESYSVNCTYPNSSDSGNSSSVDNVTTYNNAEWIGFKKVDQSLPKLVKGYIGLIILITFRSIVDFRQCLKRYKMNDPTVRPKLMFPKITRKDADKDIKHFFQYLFNYGFYKFGVETCLMCLVGLIGSRLDGWAMLYAGWLCLLWSSDRDRLMKLWKCFLIFIVTVIPIQYLMVVGILPELCVVYPWMGSNEILLRTRDWLMLPDPTHRLHASKLMCDFILLLLCSRQALVFRIERRYGDNFMGGSNSDKIPEDWESPDFYNPVPDFITYVRSWLDIAKRATLLGSLWVTLAIMFLTGTNRVNLFSMGYLIGSFIFLWQGTDLYLRPIKDTLRWWNWLLGYNVSVIVIKACLQLVGCIFIRYMQTNACWLVQLLGIGCIDKFSGGSLKTFLKMQKTMVDDHDCAVPREDIGLAWDGVCFGFLLMQRRLFHSYYFLRIVEESKAITILQSRGAELIEELRQKQMRLQEEQEKKILSKIKVKMDRIKANQQKMQGPAFKEPTNHFVDKLYTSGRPNHQKSTPSSYKNAIRSGDYYMFDEFDDDEDLDLIAENESDDSENDIDKRLTLGQLISSAMKTDIGQATEMRRGSVPPVPFRRSRLSTRSLRPSLITHSDRPVGDTESIRILIKKQDDGGDSEHSDHPLDSIKSDSIIQEEETLWNKLCKYLAFAWAFVESFLISLTRWLNRFSRDYRYVAKVLTKEKILLKERNDFGKGIRSGTRQLWEPLPSTLMRIKNPPASEATDDICDQHDIEADDMKDSDSTTPMEEYDDETFAADQPTVFRFCFAIWYAIIAHTDIVCYFMIFVNQIQSATIISLPLPLMVFLWGTLTIPRPTKTFWVTIIAYTEAIVLIKCMFQYEILPWNQTVIPPNMPFSAPRIIGVERKSNYALYDLILLLIVFLHRFMLISLGLWKSTKPVEISKDGVYPLLPSQLSQVKGGQTFTISQLFAKKHEEKLEMEVKKVQTPELKRDISMDDDNKTPLSEDSQQNFATPKASQSSSKDLDEDEDDESTKETSSKSTERNLNTIAERHDKSVMLISSEDAGQEGEDSPETMSYVKVTSIQEDQYKHFPNAVKLSTLRYIQPVREFYGRMVDPTSRVKADVYAYMFMCDFFNFMVVIFGFSAFGTQQGDGGVQAYLEDNKVPIPFLVMLILQFGLIIIDRALFLRKFILGKILFQLCLIIGVHIWMFFILPAVTERSFNALLPPPMWYMVKCIYLLLSAYQIRCGYPTRILGNFLCKGYNYVNMFLFKGFMTIPFLFELRALMDWIWTDTSMTLMDWLKMEDIFANVFQLKCSRHVESEYPQPRGEKKKPFVKYLMGGSVLAFVIAIIWFPLVLFAFGNTVGEPNPPFDVTVKIRIGPYLPIYTMSAQTNNIEVFTEGQWDTLSNIYKKDRTAQTFLSNYVFDDLAAVMLNGNSTNIWSVSPPDIDRLKLDLASNDSINVKFSYVISHKTNSKENPPLIEEDIDVALEAFINGKRNEKREILISMLDGNSSTNNSNGIIMENMFPKFVKIFNKGTAKAVHQLMKKEKTRPLNEMYRNISLRLRHQASTTADVMWWEVKELCDDNNHINYLRHIPFVDCNQLVMYTFNDKLFPATLNFISGSGIIGLYTTFVFLASRVLRNFFSDICFKIMFEDLPNVDRVLQLCLDIYLVRESGELTLEEDLFAKLVFLYRSPETMIKWTRPKEEGEPEEADR